MLDIKTGLQRYNFTRAIFGSYTRRRQRDWSSLILRNHEMFLARSFVAFSSGDHPKGRDRQMDLQRIANGVAFDFMGIHERRDRCVTDL